MIPTALRQKYYVDKIRLKKKGANKGYKKIVTREWNPDRTRREFLLEYEAVDRKGCGLFLCKVEFNDFTEDRYWDVPEYRDEAVRTYRERIRSIRNGYGLSKSEVAEFMRV